MKQTLQQLGGTLGKAFVNLLKPAVQGLTRFFNTLISLVEKAVNAIGKLLGWQIRIDPVGAQFEDDAEGAAGALDDAAGGAGGTAKGLDDAADAAKKLNKQLMAYDEINNIKLPDEDEDTSGSGSPGGGGGGGGASGGGAGEGGAATGGGVTWKKYESDIDTWFELGRRISDTITEALNSIDWDSIQAKSRRFGENLGHFLNGLITPDMFYAVGRTIAEGGNTIVYFLQELGHTFDAVNFGESLAAGVSGFFENFDFVAFGDTVNTWASNILTTVITFLKKTPWKLIGQKIGEFLEEIDFLETGKKIAIALYEAINAAFELYGGMLKSAPLETALATLGGIGLFAITHKKSIKTLADHINNAVNGTQSFLDLVQLAATDSDGRFVGFGQTLANLGEFMSPLAKTVTGIVTGISEFFLVKDGVADIIDVLKDQEKPWAEKWENLKAPILEVSGAFTGAWAAFTLVFGVPGGLIAAGLVAAVGAWVAYREDIKETINEATLKSVGQALLNPGGVSIEDLATPYIEYFGAVKEAFDDVSAASDGLEEAKKAVDQTADKIDVIGFAMDNGATATQSKCTEIKGYFDDLLAHTKTVMNDEYNTIVTGLAGSMGVALEAAGISVPSVIATLDKINNYQETGLENIQAKTAELNTALEEGSITRQQYIDSMLELDAQYKELMKGTSAFTDETRALDKAISNATVDFGSLVQTTSDENGNITVTGINTSKLTANIDAVSNAYNDAKTTIGEAYDSFVSSVQDRVDFAKAHPGLVSGEELADLESTIAESTAAQEQSLSDLTSTLDQFANTLTSSAFQDIPNIIAEAEAQWAKLPRYIKEDMSQGEFVQQALDKYYEDVIVPLQDGLDEMYNNVKDREAPSIVGAVQEFMNNAFQEGYSLDAGGMIREDVFYNDWESVYDEYKDGGKYLVEGVTDGVNENAENAAQATSDMFDAQLKAYNAEAGINSPSRVMMLASQYLVEGAVKGIKEHQNDFINAMKDMASDGIDAFKKALQDGINTAVGNLKVPKVSVSSSGGMSGVMQGQMSAASSAVDNSMQEMFTDVLPQYFEAGQWDGLFATLSSTLDIGLEGIAGSFDEWMTGFWNEHLTVWFEDSKLKEGIFTPLETNLDDEWTSLTTWFDTSMNKWWDEDLTPWFAADKWEPQFDTINTAADTGFQKVRRTIGDLLDKITDDVKKSCKKMGDDLKDISDSLRDTKDLSNISVTVDAKGARSYATGGFVEDGYFFANHNELVGRFSNGRTAVANNAQIIAGIQAGVYTAVRDAMNESGGTQVVIQGDTDRIFRVMQNKSRQFQRSTGAPAFG